MKKKIIIIAAILVITLVVVGLYGTFATSSSVTGSDNTYAITLTGNSGEVVIPANSGKTIIYQITNTNKGVVQYGISYSGDNITTKVWYDSQNSSSGTIDYGENKFVKLYIENTSNTESTVYIKTILGYEYGGSLDVLLPDGYTFISEEYPNFLVDHITELYTTASKTTVTNNEIKYNYAISVNLMNDRLGGKTSDYDAGNIRYYGADPSNYIDIGDRDSDENVIIWRIIGVFKDIKLEDGSTETLIKIIRDDSIGNYSWDNKTSGIGSSEEDKGSSDWSDARLMMLLNPGNESPTNSKVYGYTGSLYWNSQSNTCYSGSSNGTTTCDFTSSGLSTSVRSKIESVVWNIGGKDYDNTKDYSDQFYSVERGTSVYSNHATTWTGRVALLYPSDYGYATDFTICGTTALRSYGSNFSTNECKNNDWLYKGELTWTLTPKQTGSYFIHYISSTGALDASAPFDFPYYTNAVYPVVYLKSKVFIESGDGSSTSPYQVALR